MKKRVLAWIGIVLLLSMYIADIVLALIGSDLARTMLRVSVGCSVVIPIILYGCYMAMGGRKRRYEEMAALLEEDSDGTDDDVIASDNEKEEKI